MSVVQASTWEHLWPCKLDAPRFIMLKMSLQRNEESGAAYEYPPVRYSELVNGKPHDF